MLQIRCVGFTKWETPWSSDSVRCQRQTQTRAEKHAEKRNKKHFSAGKARFSLRKKRAFGMGRRAVLAVPRRRPAPSAFRQLFGPLFGALFGALFSKKACFLAAFHLPSGGLAFRPLFGRFSAAFWALFGSLSTPLFCMGRALFRLPSEPTCDTENDRRQRACTRAIKPNGESSGNSGACKRRPAGACVFEDQHPAFIRVL